MANKNDVIRLHRKYPSLTCTEIAERLDCMPAYVRATARRNGLVLPTRIPACRAAARRRYGVAAA